MHAKCNLYEDKLYEFDAYLTTVIWLILVQVFWSFAITV